MAAFAIDENQRLIGSQAPKGCQVDGIGAVTPALLIVIERRCCHIQQGGQLHFTRWQTHLIHFDDIHRNRCFGLSPSGTTVSDEDNIR